MIIIRMRRGMPAADLILREAKRGLFRGLP
jgi:hypothetical protein